MEYVVASNVQKRSADAVIRQRRDETLVPETGAGGADGSPEAKTGSESSQSPNPWPAEFGWDFPFDFPKLSR
jgi:hypothetical protein